MNFIITTTKLSLIFVLMGLWGLLDAQNVGIGTNSPDKKLEVSASGEVITRITSTNNIAAGIELYRYGPNNRDWRIINDGGLLRIQTGLNMGVSPLYNLMNMDGDGNQVEIAGKLAIGLPTASHQLTVESLNDNTARLIGPEIYGSGARLNFGDADYVYLDEDSDDDLTIYATGRTAMMGGEVGVGTLSPSHQLTVSNTNNDNTLRLIGPDGSGAGARLNFGDGDHVYLDEDGDDDLTIYAADRTAIMGGEVGVGTNNPSHRLSVLSPNSDNTLRLMGPDSYGSGARLNFGDGDYVFLDEDIDDNLLVNADGRIAMMSNTVGVGTISPSHKLTVSSTGSDNALRLIGPESVGSGARLNFGDGDYVYLDEDQDDRLTIHASNRTAITGGNVGIGTTGPTSKLEVYGSSANLEISNTSETEAGIIFNDAQAPSSQLSRIVYNSGGQTLNFYHYNNRSLWFDNSNSNMYVKNSSAAVATWFTSAGSHPAIVPASSGWGYIGSSGHYWRYMYGSDIYTDAGWPLGWVLLDTYDDLELLNNIQADTVWDESIQHHVMVMKPESLPKAITKQDTLGDGSLSEVFVSYKRLTGLLIGAARQLDKETLERDRRLANRTEMLANAMGMGFQEGMISQPHIQDQGIQQSNENMIRVEFSEAFKSKLNGENEIVVHITPRSWYQRYMVAEVDQEGFVLRVEQDPSEPVFKFNWQASTTLNIETSPESGVEDIFYTKPIKVTGKHPTLPTQD